VSVTDLGEWVLSGGLLVGIGVLGVRELVSGGRRGRLHLLAAVRAPQARRAAIQASVQDPAFDPERIEAAVTTILQLTDPALVETALGHIVEARERCSDGSDAPLLAVATGAGAHALTFPRTGHGPRRVRDARLKRWDVTGLDARATPPTVTVNVRVRAAAWTDDDVRAGDDRETRRLDLVWTLGLDEATHDHPRWRLAGSADAS
jgi:hypothetical protein